MNNLKEKFKKRAANLKKEVKKNRTAEKSDKEDGKRYINEKICPFMSDSHGQVACTPQCKIHRANKKGFECIFSELVPISFNASTIQKYIKDYLELEN